MTTIPRRPASIPLYGTGFYSFESLRGGRQDFARLSTAQNAAHRAARQDCNAIPIYTPGGKISLIIRQDFLTCPLTQAYIAYSAPFEAMKDGPDPLEVLTKTLKLERAVWTWLKAVGGGSIEGGIKALYQLDK